MATNSYSAGNLEMQIQAVGTNATASLSTVNEHLRTMISLVGTASSSFKAVQRTLASISRLKFSSLDKLSSGLKKISQINTTNLSSKMSSISNVITPLSQLSSSISGVGQINTFANGLQKIVNLDVTKFTTQIQQLTASLRPFLTELANSTPALNAFASAMASVKGTRTIRFSKLDSSGRGGGSYGDKINKAFNFGKILSQLYFIRNYTQQIGRGITNMVQNAIDYTETLNLWQVAMGENIEQADIFIQKMNEAYGISEQTLMNYQATFRNMLSALGGIADATSYALSEYLTQMALDYASLYNVSIERAMTVFQSVLSGQVRPIRTISGYDITENTIFQLYQQLGGTKSMRQLSQVEKRLLRIYAVFEQMQTSGAIGDLNKTLNNSANQLRILSEALKELGTWIGIIFEMYLRPILPYLNAFVITLKNIIQALAQSMGYVPFQGAIESVEEYNEALDETTGKLLSFDRFEALNTGTEDTGLGIDTALLEGLSQYQSILAGVTNQATELAEKWTAWWVDADTGRLTQQAQELLDVLKAIGITLGILMGYKLVTSIGSLIGKITGLTNASKLLNGVLMTSIVYTIIKVIEAFQEGDTLCGILATTIGVTLASAFIYLNRQIIKTTATKIIAWFQNIQLQGALATTTMQKFHSAMSYVAIAVGTAISSFMIFDNILNMFDGTAKQVVSIISIIVGALSTLLGVILAIKGGLKGGLLGATVAGLGVGALIAGIKNAAVSNSDMSNLTAYRNGGMVEDGVFTMSRGEIIGDFDDGTTVVANNMQIIEGIRQGVYDAVVSGMRQSGSNGGVGNVYLDGRKVGIATAKSSHNEMVRTSLVKVNR